MYVYVPLFLPQILNQDIDVLGLDDLGTEPSEVLDYGNVYTPVIDLLTKRYEEQLSPLSRPTSHRNVHQLDSKYNNCCDR